eukprot:Pgem_evm1s7019
MLEKPDYDIIIKSMVELTAFPGLIPIIKSQVDKILGDMMVAPKYFPINVAEMMNVEVTEKDMLPKTSCSEACESNQILG